MWSMVTRKTASGASLGAGQAITPLEAMRCYTANPARAEGQAARKGTLSPGKLADLIVLDRDPCAVDPDEIRHTQVLATLVGGQATYRAAGAPSWADELPMRE
ncbi:amidohydrolase domain protein [Bordetella pertussis CHLA-26]|nr:amidohydrolase domain protein [Bordetella pertussis CHLA-11]ETG99767.1 amidohydrolase domain protein [Bordetella pertussis 2250905]ETH04718.1 amidohydrolase domain protein [Bordetella pertussis 2356847]ETH07610.1 amidohydrolase domain protein [Bordetella pertussis 2371640]ETH21242.1 amidohydrolase domain protein [Bordetella pertussis CHLA-13]ETH24643.1 amidohydrolase domain protein [Bordetella pertussis CHLA-15]ETH25713.1 amidohydrolase domain protein [Bordetella pertussis CHLA-20]ETH2985